MKHLLKGNIKVLDSGYQSSRTDLDLDSNPSNVRRTVSISSAKYLDLENQNDDTGFEYQRSRRFSKISLASIASLAKTPSKVPIFHCQIGICTYYCYFNAA